MPGLTREQLQAAGAKFYSAEQLKELGAKPEIIKIDLFFTGYSDGLPKEIEFNPKTERCTFRTDTGAAAETAQEFVIYRKDAFPEQG